MLRSTRRAIVLAILCIALGLSFVAVASAHHGAPGHGAPRPAPAPSGGSGHTTQDPAAEESARSEESEERETEPREETSSVAAEDEAGAERDSTEGDDSSGSESDESDEVATAESDEGADAAEAGALDLAVTGGETLVQVGRTATYGLAVENTGDGPLQDVVVEALLAAELDVIDAGDGTVSGSTLTWTLPVLAPGAEASLDVQVRLAREGDLLALTEVSAVAADLAQPATDSLRTFIGAPRGASVTNPEPRIFEEVTVTRPRQVVVRSDEVLGSTILPVTGVPVALLAGLGALLIAIGLLALARVSGALTGGTARVMVVLLLALTACTADTDNGADRAAPDTPAPATSPAEPEDEDDDEVLGTVVEPEDVDEDGDGAGDGDEVAPSDATDEATGEVGVALETVTIQEQVVRRRLLDPEEIPVRTLGTTQGVNTMSLTWTGSDIDSAASSLVFVPDAIAEVSTGLGASNGAVDVEITLRNLLADRRLAVTGHFVHQVSGPGGFQATLRSDQIDVILNPDGTTTYRFTYALPAGDYGLTSRFEANG